MPLRGRSARARASLRVLSAHRAAACAAALLAAAKRPKSRGLRTHTAQKSGQLRGWAKGPFERSRSSGLGVYRCRTDLVEVQSGSVDVVVVEKI